MARHLLQKYAVVRVITTIKINLVFLLNQLDFEYEPTRFLMNPDMRREAGTCNHSSMDHVIHANPVAVFEHVQCLIIDNIRIPRCILSMV